jgi:hypothetical protein
MNFMSFSGFKTETAEVSQLIILNLKDINAYLDMLYSSLWVRNQ